MQRKFLPKGLWDYFPSSFFEEDEHSAYSSNLSVYEEKDAVYIETALPGLKPEEVEVTYDHGVVRVHGEHKEEEKNEERHYYRKGNRSFSYAVNVPGDVDPNQEPEAHFKDGIMKIRFAKKEKRQPKKIKINY